MRVLIADKFEASGIDALRDLGCEVVSDPTLSDEALTKAVGETGCEVLIVRSTRVPAETLEAGESLALVIRAGAGFNTIDVARASELGIFVANCPGKNSVAVAELTMGLILALDRRIVDASVDLRAGRWAKKEYSKARGIKGRTLGILGLGQIGQEVAKRALAFDMRVVAWSRSLTPERAEELGVEFAETPEDAARRANVLTVHLAVKPETKGIVTAELLGLMPEGGYFINTGRGELVAPGALEAARERGIRLGLDVYAQEPDANDSEFADPIVGGGGVVYGTHHIGASTDQAQQAVADETVRIVARYHHDGAVLNCVNLCERSPAKRLLVVRHRNRPGVLSHVLHEISHAGINVEEMENVILAEAKAACARIRLDDSPSQEVMQSIHDGNEHILGVSLVEIPAE
ncbi:NAD(P)-binding domain-containing protein [Candidatus Sumerlaeota bacterium]|nr:NAD(P)-binding domain-containing protein [Candidatus Sumerlaeota bacterium]